MFWSKNNFMLLIIDTIKSDEMSDMGYHNGNFEE